MESYPKLLDWKTIIVIITPTIPSYTNYYILYSTTYTIVPNRVEILLTLSFVKNFVNFLALFEIIIVSLFRQW